MGDIDAAVKALKAGVDVLKVLAHVVSCTPVLFSPCGRQEASSSSAVETQSLWLL